MTKEEAKQKYKNGYIQICYDIDNIELLREIAGVNFISIKNGYYYKGGGQSKDWGPYSGIIIVKLSEIEEEAVWLGSDMQFLDANGKWMDCGWRTEDVFRLKPKPDYTAEIEALQSKAKENGMKAVVTFEKL